MIGHAIIVILALATQQPVDKPVEKSPAIDNAVQFTELGERVVRPADIKRHGWKWPAPKLDLEKETFTVFVPKTEPSDPPLGLLVYISPSDRGLMLSEHLSPAKLTELLAKHHLAYVAANGAGNKRGPMDRLQLALTGIHGMRARCKLDEKRIVVAGLSGGGKMSCMAGRFAPDLFAGVIAICGPSFHRNVPAAVSGKKGSYPADMVLAHPLEKAVAEQVKFVFVTGGNDFNHQPTVAIESAYRKAKFQTLLVDLPDLGHTIPNSDSLDHCLQFIFTQKDP